MAGWFQHQKLADASKTWKSKNSGRENKIDKNEREKLGKVTTSILYKICVSSVNEHLPMSLQNHWSLSVEQNEYQKYRRGNCMLV